MKRMETKMNERLRRISMRPKGGIYFVLENLTHYKIGVCGMGNQEFLNINPNRGAPQGKDFIKNIARSKGHKEISNHLY